MKAKLTIDSFCSTGIKNITECRLPGLPLIYLSMVWCLVVGLADGVLAGEMTVLSTSTKATPAAAAAGAGRTLGYSLWS